MKRARRWTWASALLVLLLASGALAAPPDPATTAPPDPRVKALYVEGSALFRQRRYQEAAARFRAAFDLQPRPSLLHNEALAWEKLGRLQDAWRVVGHLVELTAGKERVAAERWRTQLQAALAREHGLVQLDCWPPGAELLLNGEPRRAGSDVWLPAGALHLEARHPNFRPGQRVASLRAGDTLRLHLELLPEARRAQSETARAHRAPAAAPALLIGLDVPAPPPAWGKGLLASGGALVALGAVLHLGVALPLALQLDDLDATAPGYDDDFDRRANVIDGLLAGAWTSYGVGAGLALAGAIVWALDPAAETLPSVQVGSVSGRDVHVTLRF